MSKKLAFERYRWFIAEIKQGRRPNARTLAEAAEISLPQAQRDIEFMRDRLEAPLCYDPLGKGYKLADDRFELPTVWIRDRELLLLALARELFIDPDARTVIEDLFAKIARCSTSDLERIAASVSYKGTGHYPIREGILNRVIESILTERQVEIIYTHVFSPGRPPSRQRISPRHLLFYGGNWYLLAGSGTALRTYALARMEEVALLPDRIDGESHPAAIRQMIDAAYGIFVTDTGQSPVPVRLRCGPGIADFIRRTVFHPAQRIEETGNGEITLTFPSTLNRELIGEILHFGNEVLVLDPPELAAEIQRILAASLAKYEEQKDI